MRWPALIMLSVWVACTPVQSPLEPPLEADDPFAVWKKYGQARTIKLFEEYARASRGEPADLDGNGVPDTTSIQTPDGSMRWEFDPQQDGRFRWAVEENTSGDLLTLVDADGDGRLESREELTADGSLRVLWQDSDGDGVLEERRTEQMDESGVRVVVERDLEGTGSFSLVTEYSLPLVLPATYEECREKGFFVGDFPSLKTKDTDPKSIDFKASPVVTIIGGAAKGACNDYEMPSVVSAVECALGIQDEKKGFQCLQGTNANLAGRFRAGLLKNRITIACGLDCDGVGGITLGSQTRAPYVNLNWRYLDEQPSDAICETVFHELLHAAQAADPGVNHNEGDPKDQVFACSLYCSGCRTHALSNPSPTANENCARCAGTPEEKRKCGVQQKLDSVQCPSAGICHGGILTIKSCEKCKGVVGYDCAGQRIESSGEGDFYCCETCPIGANRSNDMPCTSSPTLPNGCNVKPPMCQ